MAGARALWRATGVREEDFGKPIIAIVNSFTEFVPGHVHLREVAELVANAVRDAGGIPREFNTIAVDDGIAMGHDGMLYSLPSRDLIADSVEYMVNAHCADAMICISNCDKITPGMLMASMRLNIPSVFVSGGPMEAGILPHDTSGEKLDLIDAMKQGADPAISDKAVLEVERFACPTCGSCAGMFTANSMNCLAEALGMALPGNGSMLATHKDRTRLFTGAARQIIALCKAWYENDDSRVLPRSIASRDAFLNAMVLDIAMGGSTNTVLHLLAIAQEAGVDFTMSDIDALSRKVPHLCKVAPSTQIFHMEDVHRAGGIIAILSELAKGKLIETSARNILEQDMAETIKQWDIMQTPDEDVKTFYRAAPGRTRNIRAFSQDKRYDTLDANRSKGCIRDIEHAYSKDGGLAVLFGNIATAGSIVKTAGVTEENLVFKGKAIVFESQEDAVEGILGGQVKEGHVVVIRYEGPKGGPGMQEMLYPTTYLKSMGLGTKCALITDGRFSGGTSGLSIGHISPEAASQGEIALIEDGDSIDINIPERRLQLEIPDAELEKRRLAMASRENAWKPKNRERTISFALQVYAHMATSADKGAVRNKDFFK